MSYGSVRIIRVVQFYSNNDRTASGNCDRSDNEHRRKMSERNAQLWELLYDTHSRKNNTGHIHKARLDSHPWTAWAIMGCNPDLSTTWPGSERCKEAEGKGFFLSLNASIPQRRVQVVKLKKKCGFLLVLSFKAFTCWWRFMCQELRVLPAAQCGLLRAKC